MKSALLSNCMGYDGAKPERQETCKILEDPKTHRLLMLRLAPSACLNYCRPLALTLESAD